MTQLVGNNSFHNGTTAITSMCVGARLISVQLPGIFKSETARFLYPAPRCSDGCHSVRQRRRRLLLEIFFCRSFNRRPPLVLLVLLSSREPAAAAAAATSATPPGETQKITYATQKPQSTEQNPAETTPARRTKTVAFPMILDFVMCFSLVTPSQH